MYEKDGNKHNAIEAEQVLPTTSTAVSPAPLNPPINYFVVFGDSLSDKGKMNDSHLAILSGLVGNSPDGRFTNGFAWIDFFIDMILRPNKDRVVSDNDDFLSLESAQDYVRTYCIGGLTAHDYTKEFTTNIMDEGARLTLSNLKKQRVQLLKDDKTRAITDKQKQSTLVIEWSGANDLITVNKEVTQEAADKAIQARIEHLKSMHNQGYRQFILFNLPDLSLTPKFQLQSETTQKNAHKIVTYFNTHLDRAIQSFKIALPDCKIDLFDINQTFTDAYEHPETYNLDPAKKRSPLTKASHFQDTDNPEPANGYMFWDDVHPTEAIHYVLASKFKIFSETLYTFMKPHQTKIEEFRIAYGESIELENKQCCGVGALFSSCYKKFDYLNPKLTLDMILRVALSTNGRPAQDRRAHQVIIDLGWINKTGTAKQTEPAIVKSIAAISAELDTQYNTQSASSSFAFFRTVNNSNTTSEAVSSLSI